MAIGYVGGQSGFILGSTTADQAVTFALTGGTAATPGVGDCVIVTVTASLTGVAGVTSLITTGYSSLTRITSDDTNDCALQTHGKIMGGTPDTSVTITRSGNTASGQAYTIHVFSGVDAAIVDVTSVSATGINTGRPNPGAITPVTPGAWIYIGTGGGNATGSGSVFTYSAFKAVLSVVCNETANDAVVGSGYDDTWVSGSSDPAISSTGSTSVNSAWCAYTLALKPSTDRGAFNDIAAATLTWGSKSTATAAANIVPAASVTWTGAARASANFTDTAAASVTWTGQGFILAAGAFNSIAAASLTWDGKSFASAAVNAVPAALLTWVGASTATSAWAPAAAASLTWTGASIAGSSWSATAVASLTWNGAAVASAAWSETATALLVWDGAAISAGSAQGDFNITAATSLTWTGASIVSGAWAPAATASLAWTGATITSAAWSAIAAASLTWAGSMVVSGDWSAAAVASLTWNGAAVAGADWSESAAASLTWIGVAQTSGFVSANWSSIATASVTFTAATIVAASFGMTAVARERWKSPIIKTRNLYGGGKSKDTDDEDIMFITAAILAYMESNDVYY